jgi:cell division protease FtsH
VPTHQPAQPDLPYVIPEGDDTDVVERIASWRYHGPAVPWEAIVGHGAQVARCQEIVERLHRSPAALARLRLRPGAGVLISGPPGVGKTLLARALASALGRQVLAPPTAQLDAALIRRLYAQLAKGPPTVVLLDEAEALIGADWQAAAAAAARRAFLAALDGIDRPAQGPISVALTTEPLASLDRAAIRPGRLAPHLVLSLPDEEERLELLARLVEGLPVQGSIDVGVVAERSVGWSGAELAGAVEEACSRSLRDHSDALRQDLLLEVVAERYEVRDQALVDRDALERTALHEAGHALYAHLVWPGGLASVSIRDAEGQTVLSDELQRRPRDAEHLRRLAEMALAGEVAEAIADGPNRRSVGSEPDKRAATGFLWQLLQTARVVVPDVLEAGTGEGSERMRAAWHAELEAAAQAAETNVFRWLSPHAAALVAFAARLLEAPDHSLSGEELEAALVGVLEVRGWESPLEAGPPE